MTNEKDVNELFVLRTMFYLLKPNETYYKSLDDIPPLVNKASNFFALFVVIEYILLLIKNGTNGAIRINDGLTSVSAGLVSRIPETFFRSIHLVTYSWVYENFNIISLPYDSIYSYIITLLLMDLGYYWFHRMAHEINIFWAAHQVHHSSEDYNLTTALRQSILQPYTSWLFYLPIALFIPPQIFAIHSIMNLLYQFWIHTEVIKSFGYLDGIISFIFNTPSAHRVHHGRNPYCIDKNYGGVLIIWDRIFGTFEAERENEKVAYGLVHNIGTFNTIYIQFCHLKYIFEQLWKAKSWSNRFSILFKGPGWEPGTGRLGDYSKLPEVEKIIRKHDPKIPVKLVIYTMIHFFFMFYTSGVVTAHHKEIQTINLITYWTLVVYNLISFSAIFDNKPYGVHIETTRSLLWLLYDIYDREFVYVMLLKSNGFAYFLFIVFHSLSMLIMIFVLLTREEPNEEKSSEENKNEINNNNNTNNNKNNKNDKFTKKVKETKKKK